MPVAAPDTVARARRVVLHGVTGAGKSTAAEAIGAALGLPVRLVDDEFGWVQRPTEHVRALVAGAAAEPEWVFDTTYGSFRDLVVPHAEVVIGLDYPRWLSLSRLVSRTLARCIDRRPVCNGNVEHLRQVFGKDSILLWHFRSFASKRTAMRAWAARTDGPPVLLVRRPRELARLLRRLRER